MSSEDSQDKKKEEEEYDIKDSCVVPMLKGVCAGSILGFLASAMVRRPMPLVLGIGVGTGYGLKSCFPNKETDKESTTEPDAKEKKKK